MYDEKISYLNNIVGTQQVVNCVAPEWDQEGRDGLKAFLTSLRYGIRLLQVHVDFRAFEDCRNEEEEAEILLGMINLELQVRDQPIFCNREISISVALKKWGDSLDRRVIVAFYCFSDPFSEKEKNILRSLRKTVRYEDELNPRLGILILSHRPIDQWELWPESNLDDRFVKSVELE